VDRKLRAAQTTTWIFLADRAPQFASRMVTGSIPVTFSNFSKNYCTELYLVSPRINGKTIKSTERPKIRSSIPVVCTWLEAA
jgi:hypothetical protein